MTALIIDTSQSISILGYTKGKELIKTQLIEGRSTALMPALEGFCDFKNLLYIAVGTGPGSYMGVRTAATVAKTLAFAFAIPLIEFPSPLAFLPPKEGSFTIVGDAKMGELFVMTGDTKELRFSPPTLICPEKLEINTDFVLDLRKELLPHLEWVCSYAHAQFLKGNILDANTLNLNYLR